MGGEGRAEPPLLLPIREAAAVGALSETAIISPRKVVASAVVGASLQARASAGVEGLVVVVVVVVEELLVRGSARTEVAGAARASVGVKGSVMVGVEEEEEERLVLGSAQAEVEGAGQTVVTRASVGVGGSVVMVVGGGRLVRDSARTAAAVAALPRQVR